MNNLWGIVDELICCHTQADAVGLAGEQVLRGLRALAPWQGQDGSKAVPSVSPRMELR